MKPPNDFQIGQLMHEYDPAKAHAYYLRTRALKGRKAGGVQPVATKSRHSKAADKPKKTRAQIAKEAKARQRKELSLAINTLEHKLGRLEALIQKKQHEEASENRHSKAKKERAAKEKDKPKTAAEKAKLARENDKYRNKHQQAQKSESRRSSSGGSSAKNKNASNTSGPSSDHLKAMATRVRGQIAVAKQKLAAL